MNNNEHLTILRRPEVLKLFGISKTNLQTQINEGILPPPICLGDRAKGWVSLETNALLSAMVAGKSKSERRALVSHLVAKRSTYLEGCLNG